MYGDSDPMKEVKRHEQESKYGAMRQGERELINTLKARFNEQVPANDAVGAAKVTEARRTLDFLGKLDPKRYRRMTQDMNNDAVRHKTDAYPTTLARAYGIASRD